jgi:O-antigen/teichoic acid export membrane protein
LVFANCLASFLCTITKVVFAHGKEKIPFVWRAKFSRQETKEVISFSFWSFVISIAARLIFNIMPSILGIVSDSTNIAVFGIVVSLEGNIYNFGTIMSGFFIAKITRISQNATSETEKVEKMQNLGVKIGKIIYAFLLLVVIGFIATGKDFILLWMDGDTTYIPAYWGTSLIILGLLIIVPEAVFQLSMYVEKKIQPLAIVYLLKGLINVALAFPLAFYYGAFGACVAVAVARFFEVLALNYCYHHFLKINIWQFAAKTFLMPTIPGLIVFCIGLLLHFFLPLPLLYKFIVEVVAMVLSYLPLAYYVSFGSDERKGIKSFFSMKNKAKNR